MQEDYFITKYLEVNLWAGAAIVCGAWIAIRGRWIPASLPE